jgi:hypothetical protein
MAGGETRKFFGMVRKFLQILIIKNEANPSLD